MKSTAWDQQQLPEPEGFAGTVRTIAERVTEPVIRLAAIPGAFIPGVGTALEKLKNVFGAQLSVAVPSFPLSMSPLDGSPPPLTSRDGKRPVFTDGVRLTFTISHNRKGDAPIVLEHMDCCLLHVQEGRDPFFEYQVKSEAIVGAGMMEPLRFFVELTPGGANPARRAIRENGVPQYLVSQSSNFFDTDPAIYFSFSPAEPPLQMKITVTAAEQGYYEFCFRFFYRLGAGELRQWCSDRYCIYAND